MIFKILRKVKLILNPVKKDEVLLGDCCDFGLQGQVEQIWHGLRSIEGHLMLTYWVGDETYRLTVISVSMPYYVLKAEILTKTLDGRSQFVWMERSRPRRIEKKKIDDMILAGKLQRSKK